MPSLSGDPAAAYTVRVARAHQLKAGEATSYVVRVDKGSASWCAAVRYDALASFHAEAQALGAVNGVPFPGARAASETSARGGRMLPTKTTPPGLTSRAISRTQRPVSSASAFPVAAPAST